MGAAIIQIIQMLLSYGRYNSILLALQKLRINVQKFFLQTIDQGFQWCLGPSVLRGHQDLVPNLYILSNVEFCHKIYPHHPNLATTKCLKLLLTC